MTSDAATVREALEFGRDCGSRSGEGKIMRDALAALDRLVAELRECRKAFGVGHSTLMRMQARAEAAEARVAELEWRHESCERLFQLKCNELLDAVVEKVDAEGQVAALEREVAERVRDLDRAAEVAENARRLQEARIAELEAERDEAQKFLRKEWWLNHGHDFAALYGDDGEMSCGACPADFRRMPLDVLYGYVVAGRGARAALEGEKP